MEWSKIKLNEQGLLPVVVQEVSNNQVLMMAYMDKNAFEETKSTGQMVYFSRSRNERWKKGEASGNTQAVVSLALDCDQDTLLAKVHQQGVACHTGAYSCFSSNEENTFSSTLSNLEEIIERRKVEKSEASYTAYLFEKGIDKMLKKLGEETSEVIIASKNRDKEEVKYEVSDLMYHIMVVLNDQGIKWSEIEESLKERFPKNK